MISIAASEFAVRAGIGERVARRAFSKGSWRGHRLPLIEIAGQPGGAGGTVLHLLPECASPELIALLSLSETAPSTLVKPRLNTRPADHHFRIAADRQRIIAPILTHPKGSAERAAAFRVAAAEQHQIGDGWSRFAENTLRDWVRAAETGGTAALTPVTRADKGKTRVLITRAWDEGCGLADDVQARIEERIDRTARGPMMKGTSDREVIRLCASELRQLTLAAGSVIPKASLTECFRLNSHWVQRFAEMRAVYQQVVSRMLWKFPGGVVRACEGSVSQAAASRGIGSRGWESVSQPSTLRIWI
ncbi:hypothetical protein RNZ50_06175 [Paracoccaceae bacterium Fryx2]|nr:hypothetical protein [Paracoccaceae bacterium Fryx2]